MNKQKIIMENWRRFLKEEQIKEDELEEGWKGTALGILMSVLGLSASPDAEAGKIGKLSIDGQVYQLSDVAKKVKSANDADLARSLVKALQGAQDSNNDGVVGPGEINIPGVDQQKLAKLMKSDVEQTSQAKSDSVQDLVRKGNAAASAELDKKLGIKENT